MQSCGVVEEEDTSNMCGQWGSDSDFICKAGKGFTPSHGISVFVPYQIQFYYPSSTEQDAFLLNQLHFSNKISLQDLCSNAAMSPSIPTGLHVMHKLTGRQEWHDKGQ